MRTWTNEEGYNKYGYMILIDGRYNEYGTLQSVYDDFKEDLTNNHSLKLFQCFYKDHPNHIDEIFERIASVKDVGSLQFYCKLFKCE